MAKANPDRTGPSPDSRDLVRDFADFRIGHKSDLQPHQSAQIGQEVSCAIKCFIDRCEAQKDPILVELLEEHIKKVHKVQQVCLDTKRGIPTDTIDCQQFFYKKETTRVSRVFFSQRKGTRYVFPLVVKKTEDSVYMWIYVMQDAKAANFKGKIFLFPAYMSELPWPLDKNQAFAFYDVIHDIAVPPEEVIKTERVIKIPYSEFMKLHVFKGTYDIHSFNIEVSVERVPETTAELPKAMQMSSQAEAYQSLPQPMQSSSGVKESSTWTSKLYEAKRATCVNQPDVTPKQDDGKSGEGVRKEGGVFKNLNI